MPKPKRSVRNRSSFMFSRRDFLKTAGAVSAGSLLARCAPVGGWPTPTSVYTPEVRNVMSATILSGAAICMKDLNLRRDLSPLVYAARSLYQSSPNTFIPGAYISSAPCADQTSKGVPPPACTPAPSGVTDSSEFYMTETYVKAVKAFTTLAAGLNDPGHTDPNDDPNRGSSVFLSRIRELLEEKSIHPLPFGALCRLDPNQVAQAFETTFPKPTLEVAEEQPVSGGETKPRRFYGPVSLDFRPKSLRCVRKNESSGDEIVFYSTINYITNIGDVVRKIEEYLDPENPGTVENYNVDIKWGTAYQVSKVIGGFDETNSTYLFPPNEYIAQGLPVAKGFAPVSGNIILFENDSQEYDALQETIANSTGFIVDAYMDDTITWMATTMISAALIPGYQVVPSAEVLMVAAAVVLGATACAVVEIVNLFDKDDRIGNYRWDLDNFIDNYNDYIIAMDNHTVGSDNGEYKVSFEAICRDKDEFDRYFIVRREVQSRFYYYDEDDDGKKKYATYMHQYDGNGFGEDDEDTLYFELTNKPNLIVPQPITWDLQYNENEQGNRHAEWVSLPSTYTHEGEKYVTRGVVHWGLCCGHKINYYATVEGWQWVRQR